MSTGRLEEIDRTHRIDVEVHERLPRGPVVRWLRRRVDHEDDCFAVFLEETEDAIAIANVDRDVAVASSELTL